LTFSSATTHDAQRTLQIAVIIFCLAAAVAVLFVIAGERPVVRGDDAPILQMPTAGGTDSLDADTVEVPAETGIPDLWIQPRGVPGGNAAWGDPVTTPFDTIWRVSTGLEFFSAPALVGSRIYLGCNDGRFRCLDLISGSTVWSYTITCGICGEAAVDSQRVYFGGQDGYVYALNRATGSLDWSAGLGYHVFADVAIMADTIILTGNSVGQVAALDAEDGTVIWDQSPGGLILGPCVIDTLAVFTSEDGVVAVYGPSGDQIWRRDFVGQASPPSASGTAVYAGFSDGVVRKMDLETGETLWETDLTASPRRTVLSRPVLTDSTLLVGSSDSRLVHLDRDDGSVIWEAEFENWIQVPPVALDSLVFVSGDDQRLHVISLNTGLTIDSLETGGYSGTPPLLVDGILIYGTAAGELFALRGTVPEAPQEEIPGEVPEPEPGAVPEPPSEEETE
jgi:outer membrane protein assembly factor BamB